jgi:superfamily II DNA or RNA helicase
MIRGQIIAPTGSGKTLTEHGAVNHSITRGGLIHVVLAPRIALVHQLLNDFWDYKQGVWTGLCVCSSDAEYQEYYEGEEPNLAVETTTQSDRIAERIEEALSSKVALNIFSTLHSAGSIAAALQRCNAEADLVVVDEAHNLTRDAWHKWLTALPSKAQLYFTATRRVSKNGEGIGRGMDNRELFGEVIFKVPPKILIDQGRIVAPRLHLMYPDTTINISHLKSELHAKVQMVVGGALKHAEVMDGKPARLIVFCTSADEAHDIAESDIVQRHLPEWSLTAVTSLQERMGRKRRKDLFAEFSKCERSILFHYDVVSEGIDLPGATAILPLRELGEIKMVQAIGRVLRPTKVDRQRLADGVISVDNKAGWEKPYGWVLLPLLGGEYNWAAEKLRDVVWSLRGSDFNIDVETMSVVETARPIRPQNSSETLMPPANDDIISDLFTGLGDSLRKVDVAVKHELEAEEALVTRLRAVPGVNKPGLLDRIRSKPG